MTPTPKKPNESARNKCIEYSGRLQPNGYGTLSVNNKIIGVHRLAWALKNGRLPQKGMDICHSCDNRKCINPDHLFEGTRSENMIDAVKKGRIYAPNKHRTHCKRGHEFNKTNTAIRADGRRRCSACHENYLVKFRANKARAKLEKEA